MVALPREAAAAAGGGGAGAGYIDWSGVDPWGSVPIPVALASILVWFIALSLRGPKGRSNPVWATVSLRGPKGRWATVSLRGTKSRSNLPLRPYSLRFRFASIAFALLLLSSQTASTNIFPVDVPDNWPPPSDAYFLYVHSDHLGSSNLFTEGADKTTHAGLRYRQGDLVQRIEYTPFGQERFVLNPALEEGPKYTGQTQDIETDLYYYGSRYYDPVLSRFIQPDSIIPDPYDSQSLNAYAYVLDNPLKYTDPTGHRIYIPIDRPANWPDKGAQNNPDEGAFDRLGRGSIDVGIGAERGEGNSTFEIASGSGYWNNFLMGVAEDFEMAGWMARELMPSMVGASTVVLGGLVPWGVVAGTIGRASSVAELEIGIRAYDLMQRGYHLTTAGYATAMTTAATPQGQKLFQDAGGYVSNFIEGASPGAPQTWAEFLGWMHGEIYRKLSE